MSLKDTERKEEIQKNRTKFLRSLKVSTSFAGIQTHGIEVFEVTKDTLQEHIHADAFITTLPRVALTITAADCLPIYLHDPKEKRIALIHAGWKGLSNGIIEKTIKKLTPGPSSAIAGIGPGIGPCHFEVKEGVKNAFTAFPESVKVTRHTTYIDLKEIAQKELVRLGIPKSNIEVSPTCTMCAKNYFSYRRDKPAMPETMLAVLMMR